MLRSARVVRGARHAKRSANAGVALWRGAGAAIAAARNHEAGTCAADQIERAVTVEIGTRGASIEAGPCGCRG
jgi:hypothetical protein